MNWTIYIDGFVIILILAFATWLISLYLKDVSIVDSAWSLMFLAATISYVYSTAEYSLTNLITLSMVSLWAIRLTAHLTWRNWGEPEDRRYQAIRSKYEPNFAIKSLFIIFIFQAVLAWIITLPLLGIITNSEEVTATSLVLLSVGIVIWATGFVFETVADWQLSSFKKEPGNQGKVMNHGLWRYSRHPNYFGESLVWWGFYLIAVSTGAWWTLPAPLLITWLLLKFSGVVMLEETITERRPAYREYILTTNAFIPGPVKQSPSKTKGYKQEHAS